MDKNIFWQHLIECKEDNIENFKNNRHLYYSFNSGFSYNESIDDIFVISNAAESKYKYQINIYNEKLFICFDELDEDLIDYAKLYLPLLLAKYISIDKPFVIAHFAQTLDGKIATVSGKSKWISNDENLDHAHRLRAMADGVLVGGSTIKEDLPQLTVRRVTGNNPCRIFWCNSIDDFSSYSSEGTTTYLIRSKKNGIENKNGIEHVILYENEDNPIEEVLVQLKKMDIHSIFVEGGSYTISKFNNAKAIDQIQIHIAPILFGSGKSGIVFEAIDDVRDALEFEGDFMKSQGHVMFNGRPIYKNKKVQ